MMARPISRRAFVATLALGGAAFAGYSTCVEPTWLDVGRHDVATNVPGPPIKLLHLSDFHASWCVSLDYIREAIECGLRLKPDLICVTGDFITRTYADFESYQRVLSLLPAAAPTFASLGNHDGGGWSAWHHGYRDTSKVRELIQKSGLELLHNRSTVMDVQGRKIALTGLGDCYAMEANPWRAFHSPIPSGALRIVLSHNPDTKVMLKPFTWDLMLCGHTHGGQIWLPLIGAPFAPVEDKRFIAGLYRWSNRWLHITKGVGNVHGLRFNCRPEVSLLTIA
jgi:predicted MPP superfamily phosphohydrolase